MRSTGYKTWVLGLIILGSLNLLGCSGLFNPYRSNFSCPDPYKGACSDVEKSYQASVTGADKQASTQHKIEQEQNKEPQAKRGDESAQTPHANTANGSGQKVCKDCKQGSPVPAQDYTTEDLYKRELFSKLSSLIEAPKTPIVVPPEVMRILLLGYTTEDKELLSSRYIYIFVSEPRWIIDPSQEIK